MHDFCQHYRNNVLGVEGYVDTSNQSSLPVFPHTIPSPYCWVFIGLKKKKKRETYTTYLSAVLLSLQLPLNLTCGFLSV